MALSLPLKLRLDLYAGAMNAAQGIEQPGQIVSSIKALADLTLGCQPGPLQCTVDLLAHGFELRLHGLEGALCRWRWLGRRLLQQRRRHGQGGLERMPEVRMASPGALDDLLDLPTQMVDLADQRLEFFGHAFVQLQALAHMPLGKFRPGASQGFEGVLQQPALHQQCQAYGDQAEYPDRPARPVKGFEQGQVIGGHADIQRLTLDLVATGPYQ